MKLSGCLYLIALLFQLNFAYAQVDSSNENKVWYSLSLSKKISNRWSVNNLSLLGMRSFRHDFWFFQNNLGANFKINKLLSVTAGYGLSKYQYSPWWDGRYPQRPGFLNYVNFHSIIFDIQRKTEIGGRFQMSNELTMQYYMPKFEKYETKFQYSLRLGYRKRDLPLGIKPFFQGALFYYLNGEKTYYYDQNNYVTSVSSPDGIHRFRGKVGINFIPAEDYKNFSITLYYGINREFNLKGSGHDLNTERPSASGRTILITNPFNSYNILGLQLGFSF